MKEIPENKNHGTNMLTFVPRKDMRGRRAATTIPFSPTVTATFLSVPPFPQLGQNILPISVVTLKQAWHFSIHLKIH